jgi:alkylation response protein AidB-like acyl-CoA dehydrogenase
MNDPFPAYAPSEEHELLRATVRELAEDKIAPAAADVDEQSRYPQEALDALTGPACMRCTSRMHTAARAPTRWPPSS